MRLSIEEFAARLRGVELTAEDAEYIVALTRSRVRMVQTFDADGNDMGETQSLTFTPSVVE